MIKNVNLFFQIQLQNGSSTFDPEKRMPVLASFLSVP
jgi:hypothetical protein